MSKRYEYDAVIHKLPEKGGAYVVCPWDIRQEFGKGRVEIHATFDGIPYDGSIVNMGVKNEDGSVCYILGMLKAIRTQLGNSPWWCYGKRGRLPSNVSICMVLPFLICPVAIVYRKQTGFATGSFLSAIL